MVEPIDFGINPATLLAFFISIKNLHASSIITLRFSYFSSFTNLSISFTVVFFNDMDMFLRMGGIHIGFTFHSPKLQKLFNTYAVRNMLLNIV